MGKLFEEPQHKSKRAAGRDEVDFVREQILSGDTKRLNCDVPVYLYKKLQIKAIEEDSSITAVINRLVEEYVRS